MFSFLNPFRDISFVSLLFRMGLAFVIGMAIGLERSAKNRPAGLRTHILVCIGAATASLTGHYLYLNLQMPADVTRLGGQVISGLGFLGAGTIIVTRKKTVIGLTTAAGLWTTGIIGLAIGAGFYEGGVIAAVVVLVTETVFPKFIGSHLHWAPDFRITLHYTKKNALDKVMRHCKDKRLAIIDLQVTSTGEGKQLEYKALISLRPNGSVSYEELLNYIYSIPGVESAII